MKQYRTSPRQPLRLIPELHRATHRVGLYLDRLGISQGEGHILSHLAVAGHATIAELHRTLAHRRSTLTSILDRLVSRGYITRDSDPQDRRSFVVHLSKEGKRAAEQVHAQLAAIELQALQNVTGKRIRSVIELLNTLETTAARAANNLSTKRS